MALVGKKFPNVTVDAISKSGENQRINILDEAVNKQTKVKINVRCNFMITTPLIGSYFLYYSKPL